MPSTHDTPPRSGRWLCAPPFRTVSRRRSCCGQALGRSWPPPWPGSTAPCRVSWPMSIWRPCSPRLRSRRRRPPPPRRKTRRRPSPESGAAARRRSRRRPPSPPRPRAPHRMRRSLPGRRSLPPRPPDPAAAVPAAAGSGRSGPRQKKHDKRPRLWRGLFESATVGNTAPGQSGRAPSVTLSAVRPGPAAGPPRSAPPPGPSLRPGPAADP